jgi:hypothetical protein
MCMPWLSGQKGTFLSDMHAWLRDGKVACARCFQVLVFCCAVTLLQRCGWWSAFSKALSSGLQVGHSDN